MRVRSLVPRGAVAFGRVAALVSADNALVLTPALLVVYTLATTAGSLTPMPEWRLRVGALIIYFLIARALLGV